MMGHISIYQGGIFKLENYKIMCQENFLSTFTSNWIYLSRINFQIVYQFCMFQS